MPKPLKHHRLLWDEFCNEYNMVIFNNDLEIIAIEALAQSRYLICKKGETEYCLTVVVGEDVDYPQDDLYKMENIITFNAFTELENEQDKASVMKYYLKRLSIDSIRKINEIFKAL